MGMKDQGSRMKDGDEGLSMKDGGSRIKDQGWG